MDERVTAAFGAATAALLTELRAELQRAQPAAYEQLCRTLEAGAWLRLQTNLSALGVHDTTLCVVGPSGVSAELFTAEFGGSHDEPGVPQ